MVGGDYILRLTAGAARGAGQSGAAAWVRPIGTLLVEKHEDWLTGEKAFPTFEDAPAEETTAKVTTMAVGQ